MSLSESKCWYLNNCLHFLLARCSIVNYFGVTHYEHSIFSTKQNLTQKMTKFCIFPFLKGLSDKLDYFFKYENPLQTILSCSSFNVNNFNFFSAKQVMNAPKTLMHK